MYKIYRKIFEIIDVFNSKLRIVHLKLKYPNLVIDNKTFVEKNCKIVCVDSGVLFLKSCHLSEGTFIIVAENAKLVMENTFVGRNCLISCNKRITINSRNGCYS